MRRPLPLLMIVALVTAVAGCTSSLGHGDRISDGSHAFVLHVAQVIDEIGGETPPEGQTFLVVKYEVENLRAGADVERIWTHALALQAKDEVYGPVRPAALDGEMVATSLEAGEARTGYIAYLVPDGIGEFTLAVTLPMSGNRESFEFRPLDKRIGVNTDYVLERLDQIERTKRIPVIGGLLASFSRAPIRRLGTVLVSEGEIEGLVEGTTGRPEAERRAAVEHFLQARGQGELE